MMTGATGIDLVNADLDRVLERFDAGLIDGRRLFVTGGTGFFGFWLLGALSRLVARGVHINVTVLSRQPDRFLARHPHLRQPWLKFLAGDVATYAPPPGRFDHFIHAATDTSAAAHRHPLRIFDTIVAGSRRILQHAADNEAERVLAVSSGAVYGNFPPGVTHITEDALCACDPADPGNAYGEGKRAMEALAAVFLHERGVPSVIARGFAFVGPELPLDGHFAIGNFVRDALAGGPLIIKGDGTPLRSYLYGADLAVWLLEILVRGTPGRCYNVGSDRALSIAEIATRVRDLIAPRAEIRILRTAAAGPRNCYVPSIARARNELGLAPWTELGDAVIATAAWERAASGCPTC